MNLLKKIILSLVTITFMTTSTYAWKIVFDPTAVAKATAQITKMKQQIALATDTLIATTGIKDAVNFYEDIKELTEVMEQFKVEITDLDIENPKSQIGQLAQQIFTKNQIFDNCNADYLSSLQKETCKNKQIRNVSNIATTIVYSQELEKTGKRLQELSTKLSKAEDMKTSQDIGNAINLELAQLEISKQKVALMEKSNIAKDKADYDRLKQERDKTGGGTADTTGIFK